MDQSRFMEEVDAPSINITWHYLIPTVKNTLHEKRKQTLASVFKRRSSKWLCCTTSSLSIWMIPRLIQLRALSERFSKYFAPELKMLKLLLCRQCNGGLFLVKRIFLS